MSWRELFEESAAVPSEHEPADKDLCFLVDLDAGGASPRLDWSISEPVVSLMLATQSRRKDGTLGKPQPLSAVPASPHPSGAAGIVCQLARAARAPVVSLTRALSEKLLLDLARAGQLIGVRAGEPVTPLEASDGPEWALTLEAEPAADGTPAIFTGRLRRVTNAGPESIALSRVEAVLETGYVIVGSELGSLVSGALPWLKRLWREPLAVPAEELPEFLGSLCAHPEAPQVENAEDLGYTIRAPTPKPVLRLQAPDRQKQVVPGTLTFRYASFENQPERDDDSFTEVGGEAVASALVSRDGFAIRRSQADEEAAIDALKAAGFFGIRRFTSDAHVCPIEVRVPFDAFARACESLLDQGFRLEVDGAVYRRPSRWRSVVRSEEDWFEVRGVAHFEAHQVELPALLDAVRNKQRSVRLGDGSRGMLPERWLAELEPLALLVSPKSGRLRFSAAQALMIDGLLLGTWAPELDPGFEELRRRLEAFAGVKAIAEPESFRGSLRDYQRHALGWLEALASLGFGGCLADDMGLGKTVVVLAWLARRTHDTGTAGRRTSLVVAPKSLLYNWKAEANAFAPALRVLVHHDAQRLPPGEHFYEHDLVLTSYGTLRRDSAALSRLHFDYVILDEAHYIKNEHTEAHRAARSLSSRYRLALTGTPLENHVSELWSLMRFLNPGVFDHLRHLRKTFERKRPSEIAIRESIYKAVRPFILRRTKGDVAPELPARIEQTVYVQLGGEQRRAYRELAEHYRARIIERKRLRRQLGPSKHGGATSNGSDAARALEALLRLRQVACHPGLLDSGNAASAKLDTLVPWLEALQEEGHKSLVFSQFTGLLGILRRKLEAAGITHEYLDGQTAKRERVVARFQERHEACTFLVSLKTGGVGLNLTAADYVFILDPWWNPAAEAQAIDRAHRIGQDKSVFAYRLLAEGTVEEKVAQLQTRKRAMSDALFGDPAAFSEQLTREDLDFLLS